MLIRLKFKSPTTAGIRYVEYDPEAKTYSTDYYRVNGGWHKSKPVRLKDIRATVKMCEEMGYAKY